MIDFPRVDVDTESACAALVRGFASPGQQQHVVEYLKKLGLVGETTFMPGRPDHAAFNAGRQFVALAFLRTAGVDPAALPHLRPREEDHG